MPNQALTSFCLLFGSPITLGKMMSLTISLLLLLSLLIPTHSAEKPTTNLINTPALFVFGDSLVDTGNNNLLLTLARSDFLPYGIDFVTHCPTGRFTDGQLSIDYIASFLGLPFVPPYLLAGDNILGGASFASGGTGILDTTGEFFGQLIPLSKQLYSFEELKEKVNSRLGKIGGLRLISKSIYIVVTGSNDFLSNHFADAKPPSMSTFPAGFEEKLLSTFIHQLVRLYNNGARKIAVAAIPAIGCIPSQRARQYTSQEGECVSSLNDAAKRFNAALMASLKELQHKLPDVHFVYLNIFDVSLRIIENPTHYGFLFGKTACCGSGRYNGLSPCLGLITPLCKNASNHVFWDRVHPTSALYKILAQSMWEGPIEEVDPMNLKQLAELND